MPVGNNHFNYSRPARLFVYLGSGLFLLALLFSAMLVPGLRVLHSLQALIYIAVIVLAHRNSAWGYGAGLSVAILWNAMGLFITHLIQTGTHAFWVLLRTGHPENPVPMTVALGGLAHFILIVGTTLAAARLNESRKWWKLAAGGALSVGYFALLVALFPPH